MQIKIISLGVLKNNGPIKTHVSVTPKLGWSPYVVDLLTRGLVKITGSTLIIEIDPKESAKAMINHIQKKRKGLGI